MRVRKLAQTLDGRYARLYEVIDRRARGYSAWEHFGRAVKKYNETDRRGGVWRAKAEAARGGPPEGRGPSGSGSGGSEEGECDDGVSPNEDGTCPNDGEQDGQNQGQGQGQGGQGQGQGGQGQGS